MSIRLQHAIAVGLLLALPSPARSETSPDDLAACQRASDPASRIELCTKVAESSSEIEDIRAEALLNRGLAYAAQGDETKAIADYGRAIAMNPEYGALYVSRGEAYARTGELDKAVADFTLALKFDPANSEALSSRGALYLKSNRTDLALSDFNALVTMEPADPDAYAARGIAFEQKGDAVHAEADYRKALELDSSSETARSGLDRLRGSF